MIVVWGSRWAEDWCPDALVPDVGNLRDSGTFTDRGHPGEAVGGLSILTREGLQTVQVRMTA